jgi:UDP-3-O-[3-hydroxymyristoyl] glucosamine N-acyltransferase
MAASAPSSLTAAEISAAVGGVLAGDGDARVRAVAPLDRAADTDLSFVAHVKYAPAFAASRAAVVLVTPALAELPGNARARIVVERPYDALVALLPQFYVPEPFVAGVHPTAQVATTASVGAGVRVDAYAVIGERAAVGDGAWIGAHSVVGDGVAVGAGSRLYPHVTLYPGATVGERTALHSGVRVGTDGFGYAYRDGAHRKIPHVGQCIVGNDVEIGANSTIDRGSIDDTVIGDGTKIDNLVHIAHNVRIGRLCLIMAQVGIAGSVRVEDGAILAGQVGIAGHHTIGKGATLAAQAGVFGDIPAGETWSGYPARPHKEALRAQAALFKLAEFMKRVERFLGGAGK